MADYDMSIHSNPDAQAWAKFYCETFPDADESLMHGWFANAMMAMHDHLMQKHEWADKETGVSNRLYCLACGGVMVPFTIHAPETLVVCLCETPTPPTNGGQGE